MPAEDKLDLLTWALTSHLFWVGMDLGGGMTLQVNNAGQPGRVLHAFGGTPDEVFGQLAALRAADRIDNVDHSKPPPNTLSARSRMKHDFTGR